MNKRKLTRGMTRKQFEGWIGFYEDDILEACQEQNLAGIHLVRDGRDYYIELRRSDYEIIQRWDTYAAAIAGIEAFFGFKDANTAPFEWVETII